MCSSLVAPSSCSHPPIQLPFYLLPRQRARTGPPHRWYVEEEWEYLCSSYDTLQIRFIACVHCMCIVYVDRWDEHREAWFRMKSDVIPDLMDNVEEANEVLSAIDAWYDGTLVDPEDSMMRPEQLTNELPEWVRDEDRVWLLQHA